MRHWPGNALRALTISLVGGLCVIAYTVMRIASLFVWPRARRASFVARLRGRLLRWYMSLLGATFIKLGQVMSSRPDLFPPAMIDELRKLQDRVPSFSYRRVRTIIEQELGAPIESHFAELDREPVAAASVAQVHRARLLDGSEVAVKVLRPSVRRKVIRDGRLLIAFARALAISRKARLSDPVSHMRHFVGGIIEQTDLRNEAANYRVFRENFADTPEVIFPEVYGEHSGEKVLTMTFLRGRKIDSLGEGPHRELARLTRMVFFRMCYEHGFVHADLHPGNMLVTDSGIAIFDVGLVKHLVDDFMIQLIDFSKCVAMGQTRDFVDHLRRFHTYMEDVDWEQVARDADGFVARFRDQRAAELEMGAFINEVFAIARKHNIRPIPDMTLVLVGVVTSEGISKMLDPEVNTFAEMAAFLMPIVARHGLDQPLPTAVGS